MQIGDMEFTRCPVLSIEAPELELVDLWRRRGRAASGGEAGLHLDERLAQAFDQLDALTADEVTVGG